MFLCAIRENIIAQVFLNLRKNNRARKYLQNECDILTTRILLIFAVISDLKLIISVIIAVKHTNAIHWYNAFQSFPIFLFHTLFAFRVLVLIFYTSEALL